MSIGWRECLLICQYLEPQAPTEAGFGAIGYAMALLDNTVNAFKLEKKAGESRGHFLVQRNLEAIARARGIPSDEARRHIPDFE